MKNTQNKKSYAVYGVIGMVLVFLMGGIVGFILNGSDRVNNSTMSKYDCNQIAQKIMNAANANNADLVAQFSE